MKPAASYMILSLIGAVAVLCWRLFPEVTRPTDLNPAFQLSSPFELASLPIARRFDFPLGGKHGARLPRKSDGWLNPSDFIAKHRGAPNDDVGRAQVAMGK
jgi:hypothetical protein